MLYQFLMVTVTDATDEEVILVEAVWAWIPKRRN
jgi:hypothetical protein